MKKKKLMASLLVLTASVGVLAACGNEEKGQIDTETQTEETTSVDGEEVTEDQLTLKDDGYFKEITRDGDNPKIKFEAVYDVDWDDSSWDDISFHIDKLKVVEVEHDKDDKEDYKGLLALHYTISNEGEREVSIRPNEATLVLDNGDEIKADHFADYWEDVFTEAKTKDGYMHFKLDQVDDLDQIKEVRIDVKGHETGEGHDEVSHEYNVMFPVELAK